MVLDGGTQQLFSGFANPGGAQQAIFVSSNLASGSHTLRLSNENHRNVEENPSYVWLDVDFVALSGTL